jgi:hypothetical protein
MKGARLSRRAVLRGIGGAAVGLPLLEAMGPLRGTALAQSAAPPKRFVVFFTPNGTIRENWTPTGTETAFTLSRILAPLEANKDKLVVLDGVDNDVARSGDGDDHMRGMGSMLTGTQLLPGTTMGGGGTPAGLAGGISVDQAIANEIGKDTKFRSLELGVQTGGGGNVWAYSNYTAANQPLPLDNDPASVFKRVFATVGAPDPVMVRRLAERRSVLDAVTESYRRLVPRLGRDDKAKLDLHLAHIRDLEGRLTATGGGAACVKPTAPTIDYRANANFPRVGQLQMDMLVMALACDLTRVATIQWERSVGDVRFTWIEGVTRGHHDLSHDGDGSTDTVEQITRINVWLTEQFNYLLEAMKRVPEGNGTMLDNTLVLWVNELSRGNAHSHPNMPYLLAGGAGGALRTGRFLKYDKASHNNLLVSCMNLMGVPATTFGNPSFCTGPLANL